MFEIQPAVSIIQKNGPPNEVDRHNYGAIFFNYFPPQSPVRRDYAICRNALKNRTKTQSKLVDSTVFGFDLRYSQIVRVKIMAQIVECVPNFSEGRNKEVIDAIAQAIASVEGCSLLDVDPGVSTNRTVYTFVGPPESVVEGALNGARMAMQLIDMTRHTGK